MRQNAKPNNVKPNSAAQTAPAKPRFNLSRLGGALAGILALRLALTLWSLPISARFPDTKLEKTVALWPPNADVSLWLQRILVEPWMRYDAHHYAEIVTRGYDLKQGQSAFHPLFPSLAWPLVKLGVPAGAALLIIATLVSLALCVVFTRYVKKFYNEFFAFPATALLFGGLCGFLLLAPYNEGLFLLLAIGSIWAMRDQRFWLAGLLGALAALTRQQGIALALPLLWQICATKKWRDLFSIFLIFFGYGIFIIYRLQILRDFDPSSAKNSVELIRGLLVSPASQNVVPGQRLALPWETIAAQWQRMISTPNAYHLFIDLFLGGAMVFLALRGWKRYHNTERIFILTITLLSLCYFNGEAQPLLSLPRHMMLAFPLYITLAMWAIKSPQRQRLTLQFAFVINLFLSAAYFRHGWVP